jgi:cyanuric acid amidohydrolase
MRAEVIRIPTGGPADISGLTKLADLGIDPAKVRAVIGKTEGNGCVNDFSRDLAARAWTEAVGGEVLM